MTDELTQNDTKQLLMDILIELRIIRFCQVPKDHTFTERSDASAVLFALNDAVPSLERAVEMQARLERARANNWQLED